MTADALEAAKEYYPHMPAEGTIFWASRKDGSFTEGKLTRITISRLVQRLGVEVGLYRVEMAQTRGGKEREKRIGNSICS